MSGILKRVNTCESACAETNHPGREHVQWVAERFAQARDVTERVEAELAAERRREAAALQWAARRAIATEHAGRVLRSDWLASRTTPPGKNAEA